MEGKSIIDLTDLQDEELELVIEGEDSEDTCTRSTLKRNDSAYKRSNSKRKRESVANDIEFHTTKRQKSISSSPQQPPTFTTSPFAMRPKDKNPLITQPSGAEKGQGSSNSKTAKAQTRQATNSRNAGFVPMPKAYVDNDEGWLSKDELSTKPFGQEDKPTLSIYPPLSDQQTKALELVLRGESIFFTGCAGTGKSTLLRHIISMLPKKTTFVTASTGAAAVNIGGTTLHCFAGIGTGEGSKVELVKRVMQSRSKSWWMQAKTLIIDEISMIDADLFEKVDYVARVIRKVNKPFGGIQLIVSGDFLQLPPVSKKGNVKFCFESEIWDQAITHHFELTEIFRQSELFFIQTLDDIRHGVVNSNVISMLEACKNNVIDTSDGIEPTLLFALNKDVDQINTEKLEELPSNEMIFRAEDSGYGVFLEQLTKGCQAPAELRLKIGAQNLDVRRGLVSGARGVVVKFDEARSKLPRVAFANGVVETIEHQTWSVVIEGKKVATRIQIPLKLAWALSIHKCQGQTLDRAEIKLSNLFECGQAYVALSRVSTLRGLKLIDYDIKCIKADPKVLAWYKKFERGRSTPAQHNKDVSQKHAAHTAQNISILTNNDDDDSSDDSSSYEQSPKFASRRPQSTRYYAASSSEQTAREKLERERKRLEGVRPTCVNNSVILPRTGIQGGIKHEESTMTETNPPRSQTRNSSNSEPPRTRSGSLDRFVSVSNATINNPATNPTEDDEESVVEELQEDVSEGDLQHSDSAPQQSTTTQADTSVINESIEQPAEEHAPGTPSSERTGDSPPRVQPTKEDYQMANQMLQQRQSSDIRSFFSRHSDQWLSSSRRDRSNGTGKSEKSENSVIDLTLDENV